MTRVVASIAEQEKLVVAIFLAKYARWTWSIFKDISVDNKVVIDFSGLLLVLNAVGREWRTCCCCMLVVKVVGLTREWVHTIEMGAQFDHVERRTAYWTAVGPLHPRSETVIVEVVAAGKQMSNYFWFCFVVGAFWRSYCVGRSRDMSRASRDSSGGRLRGLARTCGELAQADNAGIFHSDAYRGSVEWTMAVSE